MSSSITFFVRVWCYIYVNAAFIVSLFSTIVIAVQPGAAPPMPHRKLIRVSCGTDRPRRDSVSSVSSNTSIESTTSTLVDETEASDMSIKDAEADRPKIRRASVSFFHPTFTLPHSNTLAHPIRPISRRLSTSSHIVTQSLQHNIVEPTSRMTAHIIPASKNSSRKTVNKVVSLSKKSVQMTKKIVGKA
ncbi:hypothetical protein BDP27DRAFT_1315650 [Rhodocollybia butyracea]|uniref:Uncharacterized protein n=1 Tax=Rhodocollybia butyracea TaxID=206335 RepID=A0A9P5PZ84_9AGAR|nr:hypothetical protein BDP27DRAFT_1315650 [Rhodocollybia butyracea]